MFGYARVSTREQNLNRQIDALNAFGVDQIFADHASGRDFDRPAWRELLSAIEGGDVLVVKSIDRLGRSYDEVIDVWRTMTKERRVAAVVLDMPLLDTRTKADTLVGKFISDIVLQVLSFVAENERENNKARQAEGIKIAREKGVRFGRPSFVYSEEFLSVAKDYLCKRIKLKTALQLLNIKQDNFFYHMRKIKKTKAKTVNSVAETIKDNSANN